jgi:hypothetical protein
MTAILESPSDQVAAPSHSTIERYSLSRCSAQVFPTSRMSGTLLAQTDLAKHVCDHRYYDLVHRTLGHDFPISYFVLHDKAGHFRGAQPFFIVDQNILAGVQGKVADLADKIRTRYPSFLKLRTLMLGNPAGPGILGVKSHSSAEERAWFAI